MCVEQKVSSAALSRTLDVLQPWLSRDRNSTARVAPSVSVLFPKSHLPSFPPPPPITSQDFTPTSPAVSCHSWMWLSPRGRRRPAPTAEAVVALVLPWEALARIPQVINSVRGFAWERGTVCAGEGRAARREVRWDTAGGFCGGRGSRADDTFSSSPAERCGHVISWRFAGGTSQADIRLLHRRKP